MMEKQESVILESAKLQAEIVLVLTHNKATDNVSELGAGVWKEGTNKRKRMRRERWGWGVGVGDGGA